MDGHEETRDQRDEDAVEDVEAEQRVWTDLAPAEEEGARVVDVVQAGDELVAGALVAEDGEILIDKSVKYLYEKGDWNKPGAFLKV